MTQCEILLRELKQVRFGKTIEEIIEQEKRGKLPIMKLKLPIEQIKKNRKKAIVNFFLLALITAIVEPLFIILTFFLYTN